MNKEQSIGGLVQREVHKQIFVVLIFLAGLAVGIWITEPGFQRRAVKAGVAEWVATESGSAEFKFKKIQN